MSWIRSLRRIRKGTGGIICSADRTRNLKYEQEQSSFTEELVMPKTRTTPSPAAKKTTKAKAKPTQEDIALRAYHIYLERGCTAGDPMQDWLRAERELLGPPKKSRKSKVVSIAA
jgi:DUF2934 family protein